MTVYFEQNNWEDFLYQRLNHLIDQFKSDNSLEESDRAYVVFDFDNTSVIGDIEDNLMVYMMEHFLYRLTPEEFRHILISKDFDMDRVLNDRYPQATSRKLAEDISQHYKVLHEKFVGHEVNNELLLEDVDYLAFRAKLRYYYVNVNGQFNREPGKAWLTYWFQGYSAEELQSLTVDMLEAMTKLGAETIRYQTPPSRAGEAGRVESQFTSGLSCPDELKDLYQAFQAQGIIPYVVSASPIDVVAKASEYFFQIDRKYVRGMNYQFDSQGKIQAVMAPNSPITKKEGKTTTILTSIADLHQGRQPIALFGDSMGDYHMMTELEDVQVNVLFNCLNNDQTVELKELASQQYHTPQAKYLVQGRDENTLRLIPSTHSIALNDSKLKY